MLLSWGATIARVIHYGNLTVPSQPYRVDPLGIGLTDLPERALKLRRRKSASWTSRSDVRLDATDDRVNASPAFEFNTDQPTVGSPKPRG